MKTESPAYVARVRHLEDMLLRAGLPRRLARGSVFGGIEATPRLFLPYYQIFGEVFLLFAAVFAPYTLMLAARPDWQTAFQATSFAAYAAYAALVASAHARALRALGLENSRWTDFPAG